NLAPIYDELGELYKGSNIVIAKIDATANDLPASLPFKVGGFPTIKFRKAGSSEYIDYTGARTKEALVEFLSKNAASKNAASKLEPNVSSGEEVAHDEL
ncbi:protein disulfide-isomerase precursor, partial [Podila horticola]